MGELSKKNHLIFREKLENKIQPALNPAHMLWMIGRLHSFWLTQGFFCQSENGQFTRENIHHKGIEIFFEGTNPTSLHENRILSES